MTTVTENVLSAHASVSEQESKVDKSPVCVDMQGPPLQVNTALEGLKKPVATTSQPRRPISRSNPTTSKQCRLPIEARLKVTKSRRKIGAQTSNNESTPKVLGAEAIPSQEDLMNVLVLRYKHDKQVRDRERAIHAIEVQDPKDINDLLYHQLEDEPSKAQ